MNITSKSVVLFGIALAALVCCPDTAWAQGNTLAVSPLSLTFTASPATPAPQPQFITLASTSGSVAYTATVTQGANFLGVFPPSGTATTTAQTIQAFISNANLPTGSYPGAITITPSTGSPIVVMVTFNVNTGGAGGSGNFTANPSTLSFTGAPGSTITPQTFSLSNTGASTVVSLIPSAAAAGWLSVSPQTVTVNPGTPVFISVMATPGMMNVGNYSGQINVTPQGASTPALNVPVNLSVTSTVPTSGILPSPTQLTFNIPSGATLPVTQTLQIGTSAFTSETVKLAPSVQNGTGWLGISQNVVTVTNSLPANIVVSVNPAMLTPGTTYNGNIALSDPNFASVNVPVVVNFATSANTVITATPNPLSFSVGNGVTTPVNQTLTVSAANGSVTFTAQATISPAPSNWLAVNPPVNTVVAGTPIQLTVTANPAALMSGVYNGTIILTPQGGGSPLTINVTLTVGGAPTINLAPAMLSFAYQVGTAFPAAQTLSVTSSGGALPFTVTSSTQNGGQGWLVVTPQTGATNPSTGPPTPITVQVNPNLPAGSYTGAITVAAQGASNSPQTVQVNLLVSNQPILNLSSNSVVFNYQFGTSTQPAQQQVQVTSSGNPLTAMVSTAPGSGGNFLNVTPGTGTTPFTLNLSINPAVLAGLAPGAYMSTVTITSAGAANNIVNLPVTLVVGNNTLLSVNPTSLNFNFQIGQANPALQTFTVNSSGPPLTYTVAAASTNCTMNFLTANPASGTTSGAVAVGVNTPGLTPGTCNGTVTLTSAGAGNTPLTIPVTVQVSNSPLLNVSPGSLTLTTQVGTNPANQTISLTSTDPATALNYTVSSTTNTGSGWLLVGPTSGATPSNLTIGFQTAGLAVGTYTGSITVTPTAAGGMPTVIPVTLVISNGVTASSMPTSLTFNQPFNGPAPAAQTLAIASTAAGLTFSATATTFSGGNTWLSVTPSGGVTPGTLTVTANGPGIGQGSYSGVITVVIPGASNTPLNIPVTLNIGPPQALSVSAGMVNFTYQAGSTPPPAAQTVQVTSTGGSVAFTVTFTSTPTGLLTVTPASGMTNGTVSIALNPAVLATLGAGAYTGTVTIASPSGNQTIMVNLTVAAPPPPAVLSVVNSASNAPGPIAPGEIVAIFGTNIGPATPAGLVITPSGMVATALAGTTVTFDGVAAPLIYVSAGQINAIVPYEIAGRVTTNVVVTRNSVASAALQLRVVDTVPAIFSASQGGSGQGAILNFNNTPNNAANPATKGTAIQIFATGEGATIPPVATGSVTSATGPNFPMVPNVSVTIGGQPAQVLYAGEAPGLVSGVLQVNAIVPTAITGTGPQTILLTVGSGKNDQQTISVAVQ